MACRMLESFDTFTTVSERWTNAAGAVSAPAARTGIQGLRNIPGFSASGGCRKTFDAQGTWIIGRAYRTTVLGGFAIMGTIDGATVQGDVLPNANGTISLRIGGAVVATSILSMLINVYYYMELKHIIANAGGTIELRVNGAVWVTFTGDTQATANATADQVGLGGDVGTNDTDDVYIFDGTG